MVAALPRLGFFLVAEVLSVFEAREPWRRVGLLLPRAGVVGTFRAVTSGTARVCGTCLSWCFWCFVCVFAVELALCVIVSGTDGVYNVRCVVFCCVVLRCAVLCCVALRCVVLCCVVCVALCLLAFCCFFRFFFLFDMFYFIALLIPGI